MKNFISTMMLLLTMSLTVGIPKKLNACHESYVTLVSGPTAIGGGQYSTTVQVCIGQTVNWGGTNDFTLTLVGATFVSYSPLTLSNTYSAYTGASCSGPNCFMNTCTSITANANSSSTSNVVTYSTSSSTPAGYPLVPDDVETCGGANPMSYCFNFTFTSNGFPTSISLGGNTEILRPRVCRTTCGHSNTYTSPCNGLYEPEMTYTFNTSLPIELVDFNVYNKNNVNRIYWVTVSEINNDYFILDRSTNGVTWDVINEVDGAGNSHVGIIYECFDETYENGINYYRLTQVDFNGTYERFKIIAINNKEENIKSLVKTINLMGVEVNEYYKGVVIEVYDDGSYKKCLRD